MELLHQLVMPSWWSNDNGWKIIKSFSCSLSRWFQSLGTPKKSELKYYICTWFIKFKQISKDVFSIFNTLYLNVASTIINFIIIIIFQTSTGYPTPTGVAKTSPSTGTSRSSSSQTARTSASRSAKTFSRRSSKKGRK